MNLEFRYLVTFSKKPISSDFLENFMVIGFGDMDLHGPAKHPIQ